MVRGVQITRDRRYPASSPVRKMKTSPKQFFFKTGAATAHRIFFISDYAVQSRCGHWFPREAVQVSAHDPKVGSLCANCQDFKKHFVERAQKLVLMDLPAPACHLSTSDRVSTGKWTTACGITDFGILRQGWPPGKLRCQTCYNRWLDMNQAGRQARDGYVDPIGTIDPLVRFEKSMVKDSDLPNMHAHDARIALTVIVKRGSRHDRYTFLRHGFQAAKLFAKMPDVEFAQVLTFQGGVAKATFSRRKRRR